MHGIFATSVQPVDLFNHARERAELICRRNAAELSLSTVSTPWTTEVEGGIMADSTASINISWITIRTVAGDQGEETVLKLVAVRLQCRRRNADIRLRSF